MRSPSLTSNSKQVSGRLVSTYEWRGHKLDVCDATRNALLVFELFADEDLTPQQKLGLLVRMLFPDPEGTMKLAGEDLGDLLDTICWEAFGLDITEDRIHITEYEAPVFDWAEDAARIKASLLQAYGLEWEQVAATMSYADLCALLGTLLEAETSTPFAQAIYYRTAKPPKANKHNAEMREAFEARRKHFELGAADVTGQTANDKADAMFAAMERAANGGTNG